MFLGCPQSANLFSVDYREKLAGIRNYLWDTYHTVQVQVINVEGREGRASRISPTTVRELIPVAGTADVGLWSVSPIDGSNILDYELVLATGSGPGQRFDQVIILQEAQTQQNTGYRSFLVQGVEVKAIYSVGNQDFAHFDHLEDTVVLHLLIVVLNACQMLD